MWLITYSQVTTPSGNPVTANTVLETDCTPAIWLAGAIKKWPDADTKLLFAMKIEDTEGSFLREALYRFGNLPATRGPQER